MTGALSETDVETERQDELAPEEIASALDYLLSHKMVFGQDFLRSHGLPFQAPRKATTAAGRVPGARSPDRFRSRPAPRPDRGLGDQHIYLYKADGQTIEPWLTEDSARDLCTGLAWMGNSVAAVLWSCPKGALWPLSNGPLSGFGSCGSKSSSGKREPQNRTS